MKKFIEEIKTLWSNAGPISKLIICVLVVAVAAMTVPVIGSLGTATAMEAFSLVGLTLFMHAMAAWYAFLILDFEQDRNLRKVKAETWNNVVTEIDKNFQTASPL